VAGVISVNHGPPNMMDLFEGNVGVMFPSDGYFGSASHNTLFRNRFSAAHAKLSQGLRAVVLHRWSYYFNIIGNVLGDPLVPGPTGQPVYSRDQCSPSDDCEETD